MNNKYNEQITITRTSTNGIIIKCDVKMEIIVRSIIALFKELKKIDSYGALLVIKSLIDIAG